MKFFMMSKQSLGITFALLAVATVGLSSRGHAQQGIAGRAAEALGNARATIRFGVEKTVANGKAAVVWARNSSHAFTAASTGTSTWSSRPSS